MFSNFFTQSIIVYSAFQTLHYTKETSAYNSVHKVVQAKKYFLTSTCKAKIGNLFPKTVFYTEAVLFSLLHTKEIFT